ncbi:DUF1294 domain-containing protein [Phenylobacterium sp.]|uniref:DUF1294 domain-containing protein n=1 Tax=Phenylobacterium sp. TaxID=1871053 RepID=UPI00273051AF|nr:DUF1294 domain-containing protein [Phenylobacterium sp.]MDP1873388.1 DUF1294 domain-containing protein [Phenylobacterium sp.]
MWTLAAFGLIALNIATFAVFALDKQRARDGGRRMAERTLLLMAALGGAPAALAAQQILRHKTRKQPFGARLAGIVGAQAVVLALWLARGPA